MPVEKKPFVSPVADQKLHFNLTAQNIYDKPPRFGYIANEPKMDSLVAQNNNTLNNENLTQQSEDLGEGFALHQDKRMPELPDVDIFDSTDIMQRTDDAQG